MKLVKDFKTGLIPTSAVTDNFLGVISDKGIHLVPKSVAIDKSALLGDLLISNPESASDIIFIPVEKGLYPVTLNQLRAICGKPEKTGLRDLRAHCTEPESVSSHAVAHSSYFTTKLDTLGEIVYFWHCAWNHLSKKQMIAVVKHKLFEDIPAALTVSAIRKHFKDNCPSCSKATMSQKPLPRVSERIYTVGECCSLDIFARG